jgi:ribonuclease Z
VDKGTYLKPGIKISYIIDTEYFDKIVGYVKDSDLLVCEATYSEEDKSKCDDYNHLSNVEAASIAKYSKTNKLIITHVSQRYKSVKKLEETAKKIFKNTTYANDLDHFVLK